MIREILPARDTRLRIVSKPIGKVDKKTRGLIADLKDTLDIQKDPEGVGLAAPQIGKNVRVFVFKTSKKIKPIINPEVIFVSKELPKKTPAKGSPKSAPKKEKKIMEGCLSLINYYGPLKRPEKIKIKYIDEAGKEKIETFVGFTAQVIQHEIDHLNGILFIDRLIEQKKPLFELVNDEWEKVDLV